MTGQRVGFPCLLLGFLLLAPERAPLAAPEDDPERFRVLSADKASTLERRLRAAAGQGFRTLASSEGVSPDGKRLMVVLLERSGTGESFEYATPSFSGDFGDDPGGERVNGLGAQGYRLDPGSVLVRRVEDFWLPDSSYDDQIVFVMEKGQREGSYAYDAMVFAGSDRFERGLAERLREGFRPLALVNSSRRLRVLFEKPLDVPAAAEVATDEPAQSYDLLIGAKNRGTKMRLNRAARKGYRIRAAVDPSINAPPMFLLEQVAPPDEKIEYGFLREPTGKILSGRLEGKLNKKARAGFRVDPAGSTPTRVALFRGAERRRLWEYRALSSSEPPGLPRALDQATSSGFRFVSMFLVAGEIVVLLEKPAPRST